MSKLLIFSTLLFSVAYTYAVVFDAAGLDRGFGDASSWGSIFTCVAILMPIFASMWLLHHAGDDRRGGWPAEEITSKTGSVELCAI